MRSVRGQDRCRAREVCGARHVLRGIVQNPGQRLARLLRFLYGKRQRSQDFGSRCDTFERLRVVADEFSNDGNGSTAIKQVGAKYLQQRRTWNKWVHRQENGNAFGALTAPGIRTTSIAALENIEKAGIG